MKDRWESMSQPGIETKDHFEELTGSLQKTQDSLALVRVNLSNLVDLSLDIARQLQLVEDLLLGRDLVT